MGSTSAAGLAEAEFDVSKQGESRCDNEAQDNPRRLPAYQVRPDGQQDKSQGNTEVPERKPLGSRSPDVLIVVVSNDSSHLSGYRKVGRCSGCTCHSKVRSSYLGKVE